MHRDSERLILVDIMRAGAVIAVLLFHLNNNVFSYGYLGVDVFFLLSGYVIAKSVERRPINSYNDLIDFLWRRFFRLFPALCLIILVSLMVGFFVSRPTAFKDLAQTAFASSLFLSNAIFYLKSSYFDVTNLLRPLLHMWSISIEFQFYLIFALSQFLIVTKIRFYIWQLFFLFASLLLNLVILRSSSDLVFYLPFTRYWEFACGALIASGVFTKQPYKKVITSIICLLVCAILIHFALIQDKYINYLSTHPNEITIVLLLVVGSILACKDSINFERTGIFQKPIIIFSTVGRCSYSIFLVHLPLIVFYRQLSNDLTLSTYEQVTLFCLSTSLGYGLHLLVEGKVTITFTNKILMMMLLIATLAPAYYVHKNDGIESRFREKAVVGNVGHQHFHKYIDEKYFDCSPNEVMEKARRWRSFLRCKQSKKGDIELLLLGDSHAEHLFPGLAHQVVNRNVGFYIENGAPFLSNKNFAHFFEEIGSNQLDQVVLITMHYLLRIGEDEQKFKQELIQTINFLKDNNKEVILLSDIYRFPFDVEACVYERLFEEVNELKRNCFADYKMVGVQLDEIIHYLTEIAEKTKIEFFDVSKMLCSESLCRMINGKNLIYRDDSHLTIEGSNQLATEIVKKLPAIMSQ